MKKSKFTELRDTQHTMMVWFCSQVDGGWRLKVDRRSAESTRCAVLAINVELFSKENQTNILNSIL